MPNPIIERIKDTSKDVLTNEAIPFLVAAMQQVGVSNLAEADEEIKARLADQYKKIILNKNFFTADEVIKNYQSYMEAIDNWNPNYRDDTGNADLLKIFAIWQFQAALKQALNDVTKSQLKQNQESVVSKMDELGAEDNRKSNLDEYYNTLNNPNLESYEQVIIIPDLVKEVNEINTQHKKEFEKHLQVIDELSDVMHTYIDDLKSLAEERKAEWRQSFNPTPTDKTAEYHGKWQRTLTSIRKVANLLDNTFNDKTLNPKQKLDKFDSEIIPLKKELLSIFPGKTKSLFQKIKEIFVPKQKEEMNSKRLYKKYKKSMKFLKGDTVDKNVEALKNFRLMR